MYFPKFLSLKFYRSARNLLNLFAECLNTSQYNADKSFKYKFHSKWTECTKCSAKIRTKIILDFPFFRDRDWRPNFFAHVINIYDLEIVKMLRASAEYNRRD